MHSRESRYLCRYPQNGYYQRRSSGKHFNTQSLYAYHCFPCNHGGSLGNNGASTGNYRGCSRNFVERFGNNNGSPCNSRSSGDRGDSPCYDGGTPGNECVSSCKHAGSTDNHTNSSCNHACSADNHGSCH